MPLQAVTSRVRSVLRNFPTLYDWIKHAGASVGISVSRREEEWLAAFSQRHPGAFFVQIGAHDGKSNDKLYPLVQQGGWSGVLVEPVRYLFEGLVANYAGTPGVAFENVALGAEDGHATFYRLRQTEDPMPDWYDQLGSFNRDIVLSHRTSIPNIEDYLVEETVECLCFRTLADRHHIASLDLILIDTEGYDFEVLKNIDLRRFRPKMLIYEQKHLAAEDKAAAIRFLRRHGYVVHPCAENAVALHSPFVDMIGWIARLGSSAVPRPDGIDGRR